MSSYRFYFVNGGDAITRAEWFDCSDDADALKKAYQLCSVCHVEVWLGIRKVGRVNRGSIRTLSGATPAHSVHA